MKWKKPKGTCCTYMREDGKIIIESGEVRTSNIPKIVKGYKVYPTTWVYDIYENGIMIDRTVTLKEAKEKYAECALGMIDHTDETKRTVLKEKAIAYLCKDEQNVAPIKQSGNERSFTRGIAPRKKSNAGRPRLYDSSGEADGAFEGESSGSEGQEYPGDQNAD